MRTATIALLLSTFASASDEDLRRELDDLRKTVEKQAEQIEEQDEKIGRMERTQLETDIERYLSEAQGGGEEGLETAGYDGRFFIQTRDGKYRLMFRFYSQARYNWNQRENPPPGESAQTQGWEISRTRIWFDGDLTKHFYFHFRININSQSDVDLVNAYIRWNAPHGWKVDIGERWFYLSREDWTLPMDQLTTEFSANDLIFAIGTTRGVQVSRQQKQVRYYFGLSDGPFSGGQDFTTATTRYTLTGRVDIQFFTDEWSIWDDLTGRRGRPFGVMLGIGVGYADGKSDSEFDSSALVTVDLNLNWDGGQAMIYGTWRSTDPRDGSAFYDWGVVAQAGHFVAEKHQLYIRYEIVSPGTRPGDFVDYNTITIGYSFFPFVESNVNKFSVEFSYLFDPLNDTIVPESTGIGFLDAEDGVQWYFRFQAQFGF